MPTTSYIAGFNQTITLASTNYCVTNSTFTEQNDVIDVTGCCSSGRHQFIKGLSGCSGSFDLILDSDNPPTVNPGDFISLNAILGGVGAGEELTCATAIVVSRAWTAAVTGAVMVTIAFNTSGAYTIGPA
jgi:hypothetical protein